MIIYKNQLSNQLQLKLPISIQYSNQSQFDIDILDISLRVEIYNYLNSLPVEVNQDTSKMFDIKFEQSKTKNLQVITNKVDMLKDYFLTYLKITKGTYPFDPNIGCNIPNYIKIKENSLKKELIQTELNNIINTMNLSFDSNISLTDIILNVDTDGVANIYITVTFDDGSSLNSILNSK